MGSREMYPPTPLLVSAFSCHVNSYCHFEYVVMQCSSLPMVVLVVFFAWKIMWQYYWLMLVNRDAHVV